MVIRWKRKPGEQFAPAWRLGFVAGFLEPEDGITILELATLAKHLDALESLENVTLCFNLAGAFEAAMLGHDR